MKGDENANTWCTTAVVSLSISTECRLRQKIFSAGQRGCPYVKAGHISASGKGDKLFVLVDSDLDLHLPAFEAVCRKLENDLPGIMVDYCGKDPNRGCFVSYDPTAFYKEKSEVVPVKVEAPPASQKHVTASAIPSSDGALGNYMDKFETDNSFSSGNRHTFVMKLSALNAAGFEESEVKRECLSRYVEPGFTEKEVAGIVSDIYTRYRSSHGSNPYCPPEYRKPHQNSKAPKFTLIVPIVKKRTNLRTKALI